MTDITSTPSPDHRPPEPASVSDPRPAKRRPGFIERQLRVFMLSVLLPIAIIGSCALFAPTLFNGIIQTVRGTALNTYVNILRSQGNPALKVTAYEASVTGVGAVSRDMGALGFLYGEGAEVTGTVRIALGADIEKRQFGILTCEVDTNTIRTTVGRAPLAGSAFDSEKIEQEAYRAFREQSAKTAVEQYWAQAKQRLDQEFVTWGLGLEVPAVPTLITCPDIAGASAGGE